MPSPTRLTVQTTIETWAIRDDFVISRGAKRQAVVVVATLSDGVNTGRGECVPYPRYQETPEATAAAIHSVIAAHPSLDRTSLQTAMQPGAARNALDCAFWALEAAANRTPIAEQLAAPLSAPVLTCQTISLASPDKMAADARSLMNVPLLKLKLGAQGDADRMVAVRAARPDARLIGDVNEGWTPASVERHLAAAAQSGFEMIEQPLPATDDAMLAHITHPLPICADESAHTAEGLGALANRYDAVNIKLDKTGGLTAALTMAHQARSMSLDIMIGCMVSTSLSMAPALQLAPYARWVDLDGPLLLAADRTPGLTYEGAWIAPPGPDIWA